MEERGSNLGFILALIFGIIFLIIGLTVLGYTVYKLTQMQKNNQEIGNKNYYIAAIAVGFFLAVMNVWIIAAAFWMRYYFRLRRGYLTAIVLGILSLNLFAMFAGIIGKIDHTYLTRIREAAPKLF